MKNRLKLMLALAVIAGLTFASCDGGKKGETGDTDTVVVDDEPTVIDKDIDTTIVDTDTTVITDDKATKEEKK